MELIEQLLFGSSSSGGGEVAHSVVLLALVITIGIILGKIKILGVSLGVTGILFVGIAFSYFGMKIDEHLMHFLKEFGLILFVYSIGLQVGPGFFSSFRKGGITLNKLAVLVVALGVATTVVLYYATGLSMTTMVGVMSGAVTNTPGLGAAQQAFSDLHVGSDAPDIATGYAVAYPLGVVGAILTLLSLRYLLRIDVQREEEAAGLGTDALKDFTTRRLSVEISNPAVEGKSIVAIRDLALRDFVVSRICHPGKTPELAAAATTVHGGDRILLVTAPKDVEALVALLGREVDSEPMVLDKTMISRRILITKPELNGKTLAELRVRSTYGVTITRINRLGIDLVASGDLQLQIGDQVTVVGPELSVTHAERLFGNSLKRLNHPNLIPIFIGIALGVLLGSISFWIPGIPQPVKLGLAGGPLIVAILIGRYGPRYKLVTYTTMSANLMLREVGISLFLAGVGLGAGEEFVPTLLAGGYVWIAYGAAITIIPLLLAGLFGRFYYKLNYYTLIGVLSGASTNPPALAYSTEQTATDAPSVGYAMVYPLSMFLRVLAAQLLILIFA
ncbi:putative transporter [Alistipes sp.]|uniref:putative transporter n=1 Tax=Alistipes sp. TaxID=1872444 RepID=UPI0025C008D4|nr:putative transporter [Alistipes sp.]